MSTESVPKAPTSVPKEGPGLSKDASSLPKIPGMPHDMPLQHEFAIYIRELPRLIAEGHTGHYALIKGDEILGLWDTLEGVLEAGYERFGLEPFALYKVNPRDGERVAALQAREGNACRAARANANDGCSSKRGRSSRRTASPASRRVPSPRPRM